MNLFDLCGKTAVVVGASSVLGGSMAVALAGYGAKVAAVGRNPSKLKKIATSIQHEGGQCAIIPADASTPSGLEDVAQKVNDWTGHVDIVVNCLGTNSPTPFLEITSDEWDNIMNVNLKSVMLSCQRFGRIMIEQGTGGAIINISSVSAKIPLSKVSTYSASKAGVENLTKFLAREFGPNNIRVNAIIPGFFPAEQNRALLTADRREAIISHTPVGRFGTPEDLHGVAVWLASDSASYVTGACIAVDGGFTAMAI